MHRLLHSVFPFGLARFSLCMGNGENSEMSNPMPSATSHSGLEFLTKFPNMSQNRCTRGSRYTVLPLKLNFRGPLFASTDISTLNVVYPVCGAFLQFVHLTYYDKQISSKNFCDHDSPIFLTFRKFHHYAYLIPINLI